MQNVTVGSMVEALCGKCNDVMGHTVVVMLGGAVAKVECRVCGSVHRFRPAGKSAPLAAKGDRRGGSPAPARQTRERAPSGPGTGLALSRKEAAAAAAAREQWLAMTSRRRGDTPTPYATTTNFARNELLLHPVFGLGEVAACIPPDKIDVLFETGTKRLVCNKT